MNVVNLFEIVRREKLAFSYRLLVVDGLVPGDHFARSLNLLQKEVAYELKQPIALTTWEKQPCLALPASSPLPELERALTPEVATLRPLDETFQLDFRRLDAGTLPIAIKMLSWSFQSVLRNRKELWSDRNAFFWKQPKPCRDSIQMFEGFRYRVVFLEPDALALCVDVSHRYADARRLTERAGDRLGDYHMRHCLYHFGCRWYRVQIINPTGRSIRDQTFVTSDGRIMDVYSYTMEECGSRPPTWIQNLDPLSPAIIYRNPGSETNRHGAAALCKLLYKTDEPAVARLHRDSILPPHVRLDKIEDIVTRYFVQATLAGVPLDLNRRALESPHRSFQVPDILFGHQKRLHVRRTETESGIALRELGQARMRFLAGKESGGAFVAKPFRAQYLLMPTSMSEAIQDSFRERLTAMVEGFCPQSYRPQIVLYEDTAKSCLDQVQAIRAALQRKNASEGYALLVLPNNADPKLHNLIKRDLWPRLQIQCARTCAIRKFYMPHEDNGKREWEVDPERERDYVSYLRYLALGVLLVNRQWPFMLAQPQHYDLYVGIDVLNNTVGMTFFYAAAGECHFYHATSQQKEKLSKRQIETIIYEQVALLVRVCDQIPRSIVFVRDGISHPCERRGADAAIRRLQTEGRLPNTVRTGTVEIHKQSAIPLRLFGRWRNDTRNPGLGDPYLLNTKEGFVCTTGYPFATQGTARPLQFRVVDGDLDLEWVLEDMFAQAQLAWSAPDRCARNPVVISLCDFFLQPVASRVEDDLLDEEEDSDTLDDDEGEDP